MRTMLGARGRFQGWVDLLVGALVCAGAVGLVTAVIRLLEPHVPLLSLGALYLLAVLPAAVGWGAAYGVAAAVASMLVFNWFFLPPTHTLSLSDSENWLALAVYLVTAVVASELAARARRRAAVAERREREAALLAAVSASLLRGGASAEELDRVAARVAELLHVPEAWITLDGASAPFPGAEVHPLVASGRRIGTLHVGQGGVFDAAVEHRFLPAFASVLAMAIQRDQVQRDALEAEALRRSDAVKTTVLRAVSHDLRSPLTAIAAAADGLSSPGLVLDERDRAALLETVRTETARLGRLVGNLLDLSRLQAGAAEPLREAWSLDEVVGLALDEVDDARVVVDVSEELPPVLVDAAQIRRSLVNVLENALRYSPPAAAVSLSAAEEAGAVVVRVADEGPGLAPGEVERIFEPFHRGEASSGQHGSGLGLAIARGFAEANEARLWAEPAARGAVFALALARAELPARVRS